MLTIFRKIQDLYYEFMYEFYGKMLKMAFEKALECQQKRDAEGMKEHNEVCRELVTRREKAFKKRLELRGY